MLNTLDFDCGRSLTLNERQAVLKDLHKEFGESYPAEIEEQLENDEIYFSIDFDFGTFDYEIDFEISTISSDNAYACIKVYDFLRDYNYHSIEQ